MNDPQLSRWSQVLTFFATLSAFVTFVAPLSGLLSGGPIILMRAQETWTTTLYDLNPLVAFSSTLLIVLPSLAWAYCAMQIVFLAHDFKKGAVFERRNAYRFMRMGYGLAAMGVASNLLLPAISHLLYSLHVSPWLADVSWFDILDPALLMAGLFFYILGQVMLRGVALQDMNRLTI